MRAALRSGAQTTLAWLAEPNPSSAARDRSGVPKARPKLTRGEPNPARRHNNRPILKLLLWVADPGPVLTVLSALFSFSRPATAHSVIPTKIDPTPARIIIPLGVRRV